MEKVEVFHITLAWPPGVSEFLLNLDGFVQLQCPLSDLELPS